jgi:serine/threonine-protein kinase
VAVGTPEYMSPEQVLGSKDVDHRSDLWALGVVTYRALAGVMPFVGETPHALFFNVCKGAYTPLSELGLPAELDPWFKHVLCPSKEGRVSSASELVAEYDRAIEAALGRSSKPSGGSFDEEAATQLFNVGRLRGLAIPTSPPAMASAPPPAEGSDHSQVDSASVPPRADRVASDPELFPPEVGAGETWQLEPESAEAGSLELSFDSLEQTNELLKRASLAETRPLDDARIAVGEADTERQRSTREETPPRYAEPDTVRADRTATPSVTAAGDAAPATPEGSVDERGTASAPEAEAGVPLDAVAAAAPREPVAARAPTEESTSGTRSALSATAAPAASRGGRGWLALSAAVVVAGAVGSVLLLRPGGAGQPRAGASSAAAVPASAKAAQGAALAPDKAAGNVEAAIPVVGSGPAEQPPVGAGPAARPVAAASAAAPLGAVSAPLSLPSAVPVATAPAVAPTAAMPPPSANGVWPGAAAASTPPVAPRPSGAMPGIRTAPTSKGWTPDGI